MNGYDFIRKNRGFHSFLTGLYFMKQLLILKNDGSNFEIYCNVIGIDYNFYSNCHKCGRFAGLCFAYRR